MSGGGSDHRAAVSAWLAERRTSEALLDGFEETFVALWRRSHLTLGEVTLTAIIDRVLYTATEQFPLLAALTVDGSGLRSEGLKAHRRAPYEQLAAAIECVLVEFLTVLGNLTAEILTPALHAELASAPAEAQSNDVAEDGSS